jgi:demethylmenaquinone methyltransferase/2-methoxy-6-polyprenyl-1,4-benzoquinol methylase
MSEEGGRAGPDPGAPAAGAPLTEHPSLHKYWRKEAERVALTRRLFDETAADYDRIEKLIGFGSGSWYRRQALLRAGLSPGMRVIDIAAGTGLVTREAVRVIGEPRAVTALDPSPGMLAVARRTLRVATLLGLGESVPVRNASVDFVSMGYALRHLADLGLVFAEFHRVLRPGGRVCILEITRPRGPLGNALLKAYMRILVPMVAGVVARRRDTPYLWRYYWDTIEACVGPAQVMEALRSAGFADVSRHVELGVFSEYTATRP